MRPDNKTSGHAGDQRDPDTGNNRLDQKTIKHGDALLVMMMMVMGRDDHDLVLINRHHFGHVLSEKLDKLTRATVRGSPEQQI